VLAASAVALSEGKVARWHTVSAEKQDREFESVAYRKEVKQGREFESDECRVRWRKVVSSNPVSNKVKGRAQRNSSEGHKLVNSYSWRQSR